MTQEEFERLVKAANQDDFEALNVMNMALINQNLRAAYYLTGWNLKKGQYELAQQIEISARGSQNIFHSLKTAIEHDFNYDESPLKDFLKELIKASSEYGMKEIEVYIPEGTTRIGDYAFQDCEQLTYVYIPDSVTYIGKEAFSFCSDLTSIDIPNSVTDIRFGAFKNCKALVSIKIPNSVSKIVGGVFSSCKKLKKVTISDSVTDIMFEAFAGCESLDSIFIPHSVIRIDNHVFDNCVNLSKIIVPKGTKSRFEQMDGLKDLADKIVEE